MSDKTAVVSSLSKHNVPHLLAAFNKATDPKGGHRGWVDEAEIKDIVITASNLGPESIGANEWQGILEIAKYDKIGPRAKTYLNDLKKRWNNAVKGGFQVSLVHTAYFKGKLLSDDKGWKQYQGECTAVV